MVPDSLYLLPSRWPDLDNHNAPAQGRARVRSQLASTVALHPGLARLQELAGGAIPGAPGFLSQESSAEVRWRFFEEVAKLEVLPVEEVLPARMDNSSE